MRVAELKAKLLEMDDEAEIAVLLNKGGQYFWSDNISVDEHPSQEFVVVRASGSEEITDQMSGGEVS